MFPSLAIFGLTIVAILWRPHRQSEAFVACLGGAAMVVFGGLAPVEALDALSGSLNVLGFFLGLMVVAAIAEAAGLFEVITIKAANLARGSARRLLLIVFGAGLIITTLLSNDATALMLTPIVYVLVKRLKLDPLPYVFACAFVANAASILVPVANPVNLLAVDAFDLRLGDYLYHSLIPGLVAVGVTAGLFFIIFRRTLSQSFNMERVATSGVSRPLLRPLMMTLGFIVAGYALFSFKGWPLSLPLLVGAFVLLGMGLASNTLRLRELNRSVSWPILPFIAGLSVLVQGLVSSGVTAEIGNFFSRAAGQGELSAALATSMGTAAGANVINNWPMMMVSVATLSGLPENLVSGAALPYQAILGAGLGPNIAIMGSLSSMLWLVLLRRRGLYISPGSFFRLGLLVTPLALLCASLALYLLS